MKGKNCLQCSLGAITRSQGMKLSNGKCRLRIYKVFPIVISLKLQNGLTVKGVGTPCCKSFHTRVDKVFTDTPLERNLPNCWGGDSTERPTGVSLSASKALRVFHWASVFCGEYIPILALVLCLLFQSLLILFFYKNSSL